MSTGTTGLPLPVEAFSITRHNGLIRINNPATGQHQTFLLITALSGRFMGERLVKVLIGPDPDPANWHAWQTVGTVEAGTIRLWSRWDTPTYRAYTRLLTQPGRYRDRHGLRYTIEARCRRCNQPLVEARWLARGLDGLCQAYVPEEE
jgi:hypothetical protein